MLFIYNTLAFGLQLMLTPCILIYCMQSPGSIALSLYVYAKISMAIATNISQSLVQVF
jgi:hypothetical protein